MNIEMVEIDKIQYICCDKILESAPIYSKGYKNTRSLIRGKNIPDDMYIFAKKGANNEWAQTSGKSVKFDKALIKYEFLKKIPELNHKNDEIMADENGIQETPAIIYLKDDDKFKDDTGNIIEIEIRGARSCDKVYFRASDISIGFQMDPLHTTITDCSRGYNLEEDFTFFFCRRIIKEKVKKELFLTYAGIVRLLYTAKSDKANRFIKWATKTLFIVQMGTIKQKNKLLSGLLGIPAEPLRQVLSTNTSSISCIYRFALGKCECLRKIMGIQKNIPDNYVIIKYGFTDDLVRRTNDHMKTYNSIKGVKLELMNYVHIDPTYRSRAEADIREFFNEFETNIEYEQYTELVAFNPKHEKQIMKQYEYIHGKYAGFVSDLTGKLEKQNLEHQIELQKLELQKMEYQMEMQKEQLKNEKLIIEIENMNLKSQLIATKQNIVTETKTKCKNTDLKSQYVATKQNIVTETKTEIKTQTKTKCKNIKLSDDLKNEEMNDVYLNFFAECTEIADTHIHVTTLYRAFKTWFITNNPKTPVPTKREFVPGVKKHKVVKKVRVGESSNGIKNLKLLEKYEK